MTGGGKGSGGGGIGAVIVAGGIGKRMGGGRNKLLRELSGIPVIRRTVGVFEASPEVDEIVVAVAEAWRDEFAALFAATPEFRKVTALAPGGARRQDSVFSGLNGFRRPPERVLIHDGDRPFVTPEMIENVLSAVGGADGAIVAVSARDTVKICENGDSIARTVDRREVRLAQTPQAFRFEKIRELHLRARREGWEVTDDASLVEKAGGKVRLVEGDSYNIKIAEPRDWELAEFIAGRRAQRNE